MKTKLVLLVTVMIFVLAQAGNAKENDGIQKYFNNTACKVKATTDPVQKRKILNKIITNYVQSIG